MYVDPRDSTVQGIIRAAFPDYTGRKVQVRVAERPISVRSYWEGGSRNYFCFVRLADMQRSAEVPQQSAYDPEIKGADSVHIPEGVACVEHKIFCGKDLGLVIHVNPANMNAMALPPKADLTEEEMIVIGATSAYKASYGGDKLSRFKEARRQTGINLEQWEAAKASLMVKGFLDKRGALTMAGRNVDYKSLAAIQRERNAAQANAVATV